MIRRGQWGKVGWLTILLLHYDSLQTAALGVLCSTSLSTNRPCAEVLTKRRLFSSITVRQDADEVYAVTCLYGRSRLLLHQVPFMFHCD